MISKLANSSLGESKGCVSEVPLSCLISISRSLRMRDSAWQHRSAGPWSQPRSGTMRPSEKVGVVRDGEQLVAGLPLTVHPVPQIPRMV